MNHSASVRTRRRRTTIAAALLIAGAVIVIHGYPSLAASSSPTTTDTAPSATKPATHRPNHQPPGPRHGAAGVADGVVPDGVTVFNDSVPAVTKLDSALLSALRRAATDAGIPFYVNSGWRSRAYQEQLLQEAVAKYGSRTAAARWVATPDSSAHVSGDAVDLGRSDTTSWLSQHGAAYGLCQIYGNEVWHYELRPQAATNGCPAMYADPTHDPRMQK
jgi:D-alanyl-D-alanine carboxypeptidase